MFFVTKKYEENYFLSVIYYNTFCSQIAKRQTVIDDFLIKNFLLFLFVIVMVLSKEASESRPKKPLTPFFRFRMEKLQ